VGRDMKERGLGLVIITNLRGSDI